MLVIKTILVKLFLIIPIIKIEIKDKRKKLTRIEKKLKALNEKKEYYEKIANKEKE